MCTCQVLNVRSKDYLSIYFAAFLAQHIHKIIFDQMDQNFCALKPSSVSNVSILKNRFHLVMVL